MEKTFMFVQETNILHQGLLTKRGHVRKNWKIRWFRLSETQMIYSSKEGGKILGSIPLNRKQTYLIDCVSIDSQDNVFMLYTGPKNYLLSAPDQSSKKEWMEKINNVLGKKFVSANRFGYIPTAKKADDPVVVTPQRRNTTAEKSNSVVLVKTEATSVDDSVITKTKEEKNIVVVDLTIRKSLISVHRGSVENQVTIKPEESKESKESESESKESKESKESNESKESESETKESKELKEETKEEIKVGEEQNDEKTPKEEKLEESKISQPETTETKDPISIEIEKERVEIHKEENIEKTNNTIEIQKTEEPIIVKENIILEEIITNNHQISIPMEIKEIIIEENPTEEEEKNLIQTDNISDQTTNENESQKSTESTSKDEILISGETPAIQIPTQLSVSDSKEESEDFKMEVRSIEEIDYAIKELDKKIEEHNKENEVINNETNESKSPLF